MEVDVEIFLRFSPKYDIDEEPCKADKSNRRRFLLGDRRLYDLGYYIIDRDLLYHQNFRSVD